MILQVVNEFKIERMVLIKTSSWLGSHDKEDQVRTKNSSSKKSMPHKKYLKRPTYCAW